MKIIYITFLLFLITIFNSFSQSLNTEKSLDIAKSKATKLMKPLLVIIKFDLSKMNYDLIRNDSEGSQIASKLNDSFVIYEDFSDNNIELKKLISSYKINAYPALLFFDIKGGLIYKESGLSNNYETIAELTQQVLVISKDESLVDMDQKFQKNEVSREFFEKYITKRISVGITTNSELIDAYVNYLKVDELNDFNTVKFILKAGPYAYGKAHSLINYNRKIVDSVYKTISHNEAVELNNRIISNTLKSAIKNKNLALANAAASFTGSSWGKNYKEAQKSRSLKMIQYFYAVRDTTNFFASAYYFYDNYYMNISKDSIEKSKKEFLDKLKEETINKAKDGQFNLIRVQKSSFDDPANVLNNVAFNYYLTGTTNQRHLQKALTWSKKSIDLNPVYGYYDTYAHLLYRLNKKPEAIENQNKAVELAKNQKINTKSLEQELFKMKNGTL